MVDFVRTHATAVAGGPGGSYRHQGVGGVAGGTGGVVSCGAGGVGTPTMVPAMGPSWTRTAERRPTDVPGGQVDVLFGSADWGWPIVGLYTHWSDADVAAGACRWQLYDQAMDTYVDYILPTEPEPEFWMARPELPPRTVMAVVVRDARGSLPWVAEAVEGGLRAEGATSASARQALVERFREAGQRVRIEAVRLTESGQ